MTRSQLPALAFASLLALIAAIGGRPARAGELLYVSEGNRLRRVDLASIDAGPLRDEIFVESRAGDPERGLDLNGMHCPLPDGSGRFVTGEDTGQPHPRAGFGVLDASGRQVGKQSAPSSGFADPYGCAFDAEGRLVTSDVGDPGRATGQLLLWFPPFDRFPGAPGAYPETDATSENYCVLATGLGTAGAVAIDARGRIYEYDQDGALQRRILVPPEWLPPFSTGHPQGLAVDSRGTLYYADLDLRWKGSMPGPGPDGKVRRIRFDARGQPQAPEIVLRGLAFPDAVSVLPGALRGAER